MRHRHRAQQNTVDHGKHGSADADAERQGQHRGDGKAGSFQQLAPGVAKIVEQGGHGMGLLLTQDGCGIDAADALRR